MLHVHVSRIWVGRVVAVISIVGTGIYLLVVGLDTADKVASALSLLVAIAALVLPYLSRSTNSSPEPSAAEGAARGSRQFIANAVVGGDLTQVRDTKDIQVSDKVTVSSTPETPPAAVTAPDKQGGQYVNGVWIGGNLTQIDGADGNVTLG